MQGGVETKLNTDLVTFKISEECQKPDNHGEMVQRFPHQPEERKRKGALSLRVWYTNATQTFVFTRQFERESAQRWGSGGFAGGEK